ncbi:MAG: hypothetical protein PF637_01755 [Spirochaetes bacterium]|jgi:arginyl-tRNA--protein-N-Asp/Glu arginylyltransferase|nr:hypothetical protein [Spirochaetota bacterium]
MKVLLGQERSHPFPCPYIEGLKARYEYFYATQLSETELEHYLSRGWRKFSTFYFRPSCDNCSKCKPLRVLTTEFEQSKSLRRTVKKCRGISVTLSDLHYSDEIYSIYRDHSLRFDKDIDDRSQFYENFFNASCNTIQSEYRLNDKLIAVGFIDISENGFSSVYFIYYREYENYSPGIFSAVAEIELGCQAGKKYYYLGYFIEENRSMNYKNRFSPYELFDWNTNTWKIAKKK